MSRRAWSMLVLGLAVGTVGCDHPGRLRPATEATAGDTSDAGSRPGDAGNDAGAPDTGSAVPQVEPPTPNPPVVPVTVGVPRDADGLPTFDPQAFCASGERTMSEYIVIYADTTCACPTRTCIVNLQRPFLMGQCVSYDEARDGATYVRETGRAISCLDALPEDS